MLDVEGHGGFFGLGEPNDAYAQYFIGNSYLKALTTLGDPIAIHNVTFEPGCRNNWHIHHATTGGGQVLICVDGEGWYQEWGKPAQGLRTGDVVEIPAEASTGTERRLTAGSAISRLGFPERASRTSGVSR